MLSYINIEELEQLVASHPGILLVPVTYILDHSASPASSSSHPPDTKPPPPHQLYAPEQS